MDRTIAVVHGGVSHEREKSLVYGKTISKIFRDAGKNVVEIHLHPNGSWTKDGNLQNLENALNVITHLWNALVGEDGENGLVEKLCSKCKVKLLGHGSIDTDISANKKTLKEVLKQHKVKTPYHKNITKNTADSQSIKHTYQMVGIPMIVKPESGSGSKNIYFANNFPEFKDALERVLGSGYNVLVEKPILGKQVSCFVFYHNNLIHAHVYSQEDLTKDEYVTVRNEALYIHGVLGYVHHVKYDFMVNQKGIYFLEANTHNSLVHDEIKKIYQDGEVSLSEYLLGKIN